MTDDELAAAKALCDAATPGPWEDVAGMLRSPDASVVLRFDGYESEEDAAFIAASRTLVPQLIAEVERLRVLNDRQAVHITHLMTQLRGPDLHDDVEHNRREIVRLDGLAASMRAVVEAAKTATDAQTLTSASDRRRFENRVWVAVDALLAVEKERGR